MVTHVTWTKRITSGMGSPASTVQTEIIPHLMTDQARATSTAETGYRGDDNGQSPRVGYQ